MFESPSEEPTKLQDRPNGAGAEDDANEEIYNHTYRLVDFDCLFVVRVMSDEVVNVILKLASLYHICQSDDKAKRIQDRDDDV